jgi:hypothetical protein
MFNIEGQHSGVSPNRDTEPIQGRRSRLAARHSFPCAGARLRHLTSPPLRSSSRKLLVGKLCRSMLAISWSMPDTRTAGVCCHCRADDPPRQRRSGLRWNPPPGGRGARQQAPDGGAVRTPTPPVSIPNSGGHPRKNPLHSQHAHCALYRCARRAGRPHSSHTIRVRQARQSNRTFSQCQFRGFSTSWDRACV